MDAPAVVCVATMPAPRKTRPLPLADGSTFRIGPRTVSVDVSDLLTDPPAVRLHINPNAGAVEFPPTPDGTPQLAVRVTAHTVAELVRQINAIRTAEAAPGGTPPELLELPPTIKRLAKHAAEWSADNEPPLFRIGNQSGYPGKDPATGAPEALYVNRTTGKCQLWTADTAAPNPVCSEGDWRDISRRDAVAWLRANSYPFIPAVLLAASRPGVADETPHAGRPTDGG